ncbi:hypothetical protein Hanom_Chr09g00824961 [Helianthus anomalus]
MAMNHWATGIEHVVCSHLARVALLRAHGSSTPQKVSGHFARAIRKQGPQQGCILKPIKTEDELSHLSDFEAFLYGLLWSYFPLLVHPSQQQSVHLYFKQLYSNKTNT